jgi:hypothetical protein
MLIRAQDLREGDVLTRLVDVYGEPLRDKKTVRVVRGRSAVRVYVPGGSYLEYGPRDEVIVRRSGRSARDAGLDKKALWRQIDKDQKAKEREKLQAMRGRLKVTRAAWPKAREAARATCQSGSANAKARAGEIRSGHREAAKKEIATERSAARSLCSIARHAHGLTVAELQEALRQERKHQQDLRRIARANRVRVARTMGGRPGLARAKTRAGESDDEVRANIPPDLIPLFEKVKRSIKGGPRRSRTEAFLEYVEAHPGEEYGAIEDRTDALVRELERQQRGGRRDPRVGASAHQRVRRRRP